MKRAVSFLVAAAMVAQGAGTAWAWGRNRCEAPCDYVGAGDCGCGYTLQYKTEYRPVTRTVCTVVPETTQQQITENVVTPVMHEETRERTFWVPTTKQETRQRVVCRLEYHNEERTETVLVPTQKEVVQKYMVCVPETHMEARQRTWSVPVMTPETHPETYTVFHSVPEVVTRQVVCCHKVPVYDSCGCVVGCRNEQEVQNVSCTVMKCVPETVTRNVTVNVCHYEQKSETVQVPVMTTHMEERSQKVMVTECVPTPRKYTVQVAVPKQETESYTVNVCTMAQQVEKYKVQVCEYKTEQRTRTIPVTTYKTVTKEVTENVPFVTCVRVPVAPAPVVETASCAPCATDCYDVGCGGGRHRRRR